MRAWWIVAVAACGRIDFGPIGGPNAGDGDVLGDAIAGHNVVFVTSTTHIVGQLGSLAAADAICQARAQAGGLPGSYVAWLSTDTISAKDRLGTARGWVRRDGLPFTDTVAELAAGTVFYPPVKDELGTDHTVADGAVATMTSNDGNVAQFFTCANLTSTTANGLAGMAIGGTYAWSSDPDVPVSTVCNTPMRLYCFGTDHAEPIVAPAPSQRLTFATNSLWTPGGGLGSADNVCASEASAAGLSGTFRALLASTGQAASSRFTIGTPWSRPDGTLITTDFSQLRAPIDRAASGAPLYASGQLAAWTGGDPQSPGTVATTCSSWADATNIGRGSLGDCTVAGASGFSLPPDSQCNGSLRLYCFQQ